MSLEIPGSTPSQSSTPRPVQYPRGSCSCSRPHQCQCVSNALKTYVPKTACSFSNCDTPEFQQTELSLTPNHIDGGRTSRVRYWLFYPFPCVDWGPKDLSNNRNLTSCLKRISMGSIRRPLVLQWTLYIYYIILYHIISYYIILYYILYIHILYYIILNYIISYHSIL